MAFGTRTPKAVKPHAVKRDRVTQEPETPVEPPVEGDPNVITTVPPTEGNVAGSMVQVG